MIGRATIAGLATIMTVMLPLGAAAQPVPATAEFLANTSVAGNQVNPAVAFELGNASSPSYFLAWENANTSLLMGQRYSSLAVALGTEFQINNSVVCSAVNPAVASSRLGAGTVVAWDDCSDGSFAGVFFRRYSTTGAPLGAQVLANQLIADPQELPAAAFEHGSTNYAVAWESGNSTSGDIRYRRFGGAGTPITADILVTSDGAAANDSRPSLAFELSGQTMLIVWEHANATLNDTNISGRLYSSGGTPITARFTVNSYTTGPQLRPAVTYEPGVGYLVAWESGNATFPEDGSGAGVFGRRLDTFGVFVGSAFQINTTTFNAQQDPALSGSGVTDAVAVWEQPNVTAHEIFGQYYRSAASLGGEFQVTSYQTGTQANPAVALDDNGSFLVAWQSGSNRDGSGEGISIRASAAPRSATET